MNYLHGLKHPIYQLSQAGRSVSWSRWKSMGGCGLPNDTRAPQKLDCPIAKWDDDFPTLGQIADACPYSGRTLARFAMEHLKNDLMVIESA